MDTKENNLTPEFIISGYLRGELTPDEKNELIKWINSNPSNKRQFDEYCEIWVTSRSGVRHPEFNYHEGFWKFKQKIGNTDKSSAGTDSNNLFIRILRYAAVILIVATVSGLSFYYIGKNQIKSQYKAVNELIVPMGASAKFCLSDGTIVTLNAGSSLKYDNSFGIKDRVVTLEGEVFFMVAKDAEKPFIVRTSHINISALGTTFNVKAYSNDKTIETTLVEGSVKIEGIDSEGFREVTVLKPNQKLTFFKEDSTMVDETTVTEKNQGVAVTQPEKIRMPVPIPRVVTENVNVDPVISGRKINGYLKSKALNSSQSSWNANLMLKYFLNLKD